MWPYYLVSKLPLWCIFFFLAVPPGEPGTPAMEAQSLPIGPPGKSPLWWLLKIISHFLRWEEEVFMWSSFTLSLYLVGRFTETARVTQLNSSQIPLTTTEQNPSPVLSSEESTESHRACPKRKIHTTPGFALMPKLSLTRPQTTDLSPFFLSYQAFLLHLTHHLGSDIRFVDIKN